MIDVYIENQHFAQDAGGDIAITNAQGYYFLASIEATVESPSSTSYASFLGKGQSLFGTTPGSRIRM